MFALMIGIVWGACTGVFMLSTLIMFVLVYNNIAIKVIKISLPVCIYSPLDMFIVNIMYT